MNGAISKGSDSALSYTGDEYAVTWMNIIFERRDMLLENLGS